MTSLPEHHLRVVDSPLAVTARPASVAATIHHVDFTFELEEIQTVEFTLAQEATLRIHLTGDVFCDVMFGDSWSPEYNVWGRMTFVISSVSGGSHTMTSDVCLLPMRFLRHDISGAITLSAGTYTASVQFTNQVGYYGLQSEPTASLDYIVGLPTGETTFNKDIYSRGPYTIPADTS